MTIYAYYIQFNGMHFDKHLIYAYFDFIFIIKFIRFDVFSSVSWKNMEKNQLGAKQTKLSNIGSILEQKWRKVVKLRKFPWKKPIVAPLH